jgi:Helix-turn-helix domain
VSAVRPVPRLALTRQEAAEALGVGITTFKTKIAPELRVVREGKVRLYPISELERWLEERAERVLDDAA